LDTYSLKIYSNENIITVTVSKTSKPDLNDSLRFGRVSIEKEIEDKMIKT
jgi:hypothetical protein